MRCRLNLEFACANLKEILQKKGLFLVRDTNARFLGPCIYTHLSLTHLDVMAFVDHMTCYVS